MSGSHTTSMVTRVLYSTDTHHQRSRRSTRHLRIRTHPTYTRPPANR